VDEVLRGGWMEDGRMCKIDHRRLGVVTVFIGSCIGGR
jgi:hypothetical protein